MTSYEALGVRPIINAYATLTRLGGSIMPPEVVSAMNAAARCHVDLDELQRRVSQRLATLTRNEAAYVTSGAAAGVTLAAAACVTAADLDVSDCFPHLAGRKNEIIIHHTQRNGYDYGVESLGFRVVEIGGAQGTKEADLRRALGDQTAAIFWFQSALTRPVDLPLATLIQIATEYEVPVVVDAAAQLPPVENLWRYTEMGAALAIFSGGKDLRGPQASGLILGRQSLIDAIRRQSNPRHGVGRAMKVSKEALLGLLAAVERYVALDHAARAAACEAIVADWCAALAPLPGLTARRDFPNEAGQPLPWCLVTVETDTGRRSRDAIVDALLAGDPAVAVSPCGERQFHMNPTTLQPGEEDIVIARLIEVIGAG